MLTPKQKQIFEYIKKYIKKNGYSPTQKEIGGRFGLVKSTVHQHIETLKEKGYLNKFNNQARAIEIIKNKKSELIEIPLLGTITAGQPIEALEVPNETIAVSKNEIGRLGNYYALRVRGDSMKGEGIFDGDIVVIRKQETADDGQTVVAVIDDNQATLKKIYREKSRIRLQPANQAMLPIYRKEVEVRGVVVKIVRNLENDGKENNKKIPPKNLLTIKEASRWASDFTKRDISESNISYLVQYGKVKKYNGSDVVFVDANDLKNYYNSYRGRREIIWKNKLGRDLNWKLSFDHLRERDTTKHVHRLHPYKGKFIPQLVEYFIDNHVDDFKKNTYFKNGDIILDPFSGSGTTLVQANEMGIHSVGIDVSQFNCMIAEIKLLNYEFSSLENEAKRIKQAIFNYEADSKIAAFENELLTRMADFNNRHFPSPEFKYKIQRRQISEEKFAAEKEKDFLKTYNGLVKKYSIELNHLSAKNFLAKWYIKNVRKEISFAFEQIKKIKDIKNKKILAVILSRAIRSCRATTHSDLATLKQPQVTTYYCWKHKKICKPIFSIKSWFDRYTTDTLFRLRKFSQLKTNAYSAVIPADSRTTDIFKEVRMGNKKFADILQKQKIRGIFTSPPYVGQIDYHEQHAYAYDLFGFERRDDLEIGPLYKGQGIEARASYVDGVSKVLLNCRKYLTDNFDVFLVANDKYNLYPAIAERAGMKIINQFKRPVLNRTERDKSPYSEIIFHLKSNL